MSEQVERPRLSVDVGPDDHGRGSVAASLTLVEHGDFPLGEVHPHAFQAAEAAESADAQGRFWEMHDRLYENQQGLAKEDLLSHAQILGLDVARLEAELDEHAHEAQVRNDFLSGVRSGVNGTPTFFINGIRHNGSYDLETLLNSLRAAL